MRSGNGSTTAAVTLLILIWGTTWAAIRVGLRGIPPLTGVAIRFAIAAAVLLAFGLARRVPFGRGRHERTLWGVNALLSFCISYGFTYWCEQYISSGLSAVLFSTMPLFVAVLAHFLLAGERLRPRGIIGTLFGFAGVAVIYSEDFALLGGRQAALASALMLVSPAASAAASVIVKRWGREVHPVSLAAVPMGIASVVMGATAAIFERGRPVVFDAPSVSALLYLAICGSAVTFGVYYWLLSRHSATRLSLISYAMPVVAVIVGVLFMKEPLTARTVIGSLMVLGGVVLAVGVEGRDESPAPPMSAGG